MTGNEEWVKSWPHLLLHESWKEWAPSLFHCRCGERPGLGLQSNGHSKLGSIQALHLGESHPWHDPSEGHSADNKITHSAHLAVCSNSTPLLNPERGQTLPSVTANERLSGPRHLSLRWKPVHSCSLIIHWKQELLWACASQTIDGFPITLFLWDNFIMSSPQGFRLVTVLPLCLEFVPSEVQAFHLVHAPLLHLRSENTSKPLVVHIHSTGSSVWKDVGKPLNSIISSQADSQKPLHFKQRH